MARRKEEKLHVFWDDGMLAHCPGEGVFDTLHDPGFLEVLEKHPESADRVRNMVSILRRGPIAPLVEWHGGRPASLQDLYRFHTPEYIAELVEADASGAGKLLCAGTQLNPGSWQAALLAAGTAMAAMEFVLRAEHSQRASAGESAGEDTSGSEGKSRGEEEKGDGDSEGEGGSRGGGGDKGGGREEVRGGGPTAGAGAGAGARAEGGDGGGCTAYALVRPPGHHAQPGRADGYCFLNNAGLAMQLARERGCARVASVDVDVHCGNGTAEGFYGRRDVLTVSLHMDHGSWGPSFPQSLQADQVGIGDGVGYNMNVPLPHGTGDAGYVAAMEELVVPALDDFRPDVLVAVVGQDSSQFDPNGRQCLTMDGYRRLGAIMRRMADKHARGRLLLVQEGGYHVTYAAYCLHATLEGALGLKAPLLEDPIAYYPDDPEPALAKIREIRRTRAEAAAKASSLRVA